MFVARDSFCRPAQKNFTTGLKPPDRSCRFRQRTLIERRRLTVGRSSRSESCPLHPAQGTSDAGGDDDDDSDVKRRTSSGTLSVFRCLPTMSVEDLPGYDLTFHEITCQRHIPQGPDPPPQRHNPVTTGTAPRVPPPHPPPTPRPTPGTGVRRGYPRGTPRVPPGYPLRTPSGRPPETGSAGVPPGVPRGTPETPPRYPRRTLPADPRKRGLAGYPRGTPREARNGVWRGTPETARNGVPAGYPWEGPETGPGRPASLSKTPNFAKVVKVGRV